MQIWPRKDKNGKPYWWWFRKSESDESYSETESDSNSDYETKSDNDESNKQFVKNYCYFNNNKDLIECINHTLLGFYLCQSI